MYCAKCSQLQGSDNARFCSRCGFALYGVKELIANNGVPPVPLSLTRYRPSVRQGTKLLFLSIILIPVLCQYWIG